MIRAMAIRELAIRAMGLHPREFVVLEHSSSHTELTVRFGVKC